MRLLVAVAFVAFASAMPEPKPVEIPPTALPTVLGLSTLGQTSTVETTSVKVVNAPTTSDATSEAIKVSAPTSVKVVNAPTTSDATSEAIKVSAPTSVKVVNAPTTSDATSEAIKVSAPTSVRVVNAPTTSDATSEAIKVSAPTSVRVVNAPTTSDATSEAIKVSAPTLRVEETTPIKIAIPITAANEMDSKKGESVKVADAPKNIVQHVEHQKLISTPEPVSTVHVQELPITEKFVYTPAHSVKVMDVQKDIVKMFQKPVSTPKQTPEPDSSVHVQELPHSDPEAMRKLFPNSMSLIDMGTVFVPEELMRKLERMNEQDPKVVSAHPFNSFNIGPLDSFERINVVDQPENQLNSRMDPVVIVESPAEEQNVFALLSKLPENVKVVDINQDVPLDVAYSVPMAMWRGPPPMPRFQPDMAQETWDPSLFSQYYRRRPSFYRDMPYRAYNDPMLR